MPVATVDQFSARRSPLARLLGASPASVQPVGGFQQAMKKPSWLKLFGSPSGGASRATTLAKEGSMLSPDDIQELMMKKQSAVLNNVYQR